MFPKKTGKVSRSKAFSRAWEHLSLYLSSAARVTSLEAGSVSHLGTGGRLLYLMCLSSFLKRPKCVARRPSTKSDMVVTTVRKQDSAGCLQRLMHPIIRTSFASKGVLCGSSQVILLAGTFSQISINFGIAGQNDTDLLMTSRTSCKFISGSSGSPFFTSR